MKDKFIQFLKDHGFQDIDGQLIKYSVGVKTGRPIAKVYSFDGNKATKTVSYSDGETITKKSFNVKNVVYTPDGRYRVEKKISFKAMEREAMESCGLVRVVGPVSGKVYYE